MSPPLGLWFIRLLRFYKHVAPLGLNAPMHCITFQILFSIL